MSELVTKIVLDSGVKYPAIPSLLVDRKGEIIAYGSYDGHTFKSLNDALFPLPEPGLFGIYNDPRRN